MLPSTPELLAKTHAAAIRFLNTEAETGLTFARMAERTRNADKRGRYCHYARLAYQDRFGPARNREGHIRSNCARLTSKCRNSGNCSAPTRSNPLRNRYSPNKLDPAV